jgi:hypothetical protein
VSNTRLGWIIQCSFFQNIPFVSSSFFDDFFADDFVVEAESDFFFFGEADVAFFAVGLESSADVWKLNRAAATALAGREGRAATADTARWEKRSDNDRAMRGVNVLRGEGEKRKRLQKTEVTNPRGPSLLSPALFGKWLSTGTGLVPRCNQGRIGDVSGNSAAIARD